MLLNWGIEARKWQMVVSKNSPVSFNTSFKAIFAGNALAFFTPNRTGEYFGRMLYLESGKEDRVDSANTCLQHRADDGYHCCRRTGINCDGRKMLTL